SASRISASDGSGLWSSSHFAVSIIPGVQKPHCNPWQCANACCTGSSPQAPQLDVSHPQWEPVRPSSSRTKWISSSRGSMTLAYSVPLTLTVICTSGHPASSGYGAAQRADSQFAGEVALVLGRAALVGDGAAMLGRDLTGPGVAFLRRGRAAQEL